MKVTAVLLAAGQGTRMKSDLPKMLHPICGKPMLAHSLAAVMQASDESPVVVVGHEADRDLALTVGLLVNRGGNRSLLEVRSHFREQVGRD